MYTVNYDATILYISHSLTMLPSHLTGCRNSEENRQHLRFLLNECLLQYLKYLRSEKNTFRLFPLGLTSPFGSSPPLHLQTLCQ